MSVRTYRFSRPALPRAAGWLLSCCSQGSLPAAPASSRRVPTTEAGRALSARGEPTRRWN